MCKCVCAFLLYSKVYSDYYKSVLGDKHFWKTVSFDIDLNVFKLNNISNKIPYNANKILPSYKINKQKWDDCIKNSSNPLIYAASVYLDHMADNWDGFIADDYRLVMPVPWRKKYGINIVIVFRLFSNWVYLEKILSRMKSMFYKTIE